MNVSSTIVHLYSSDDFIQDYDDIEILDRFSVIALEYYGEYAGHTNDVAIYSFPNDWWAQAFIFRVGELILNEYYID